MQRVSDGRRMVPVAGRIALAVVPVGAVLGIATGASSGSDVSDPLTLALRIAAGIGISTFTLGLVALLIGRGDGSRAARLGLPRTHAGLAVWGAVLWLVPAAVAFGVLALLGASLTVAVPAGEFLQTVVLVLLAVLLTEAIPEEVLFRGYVTTVLGTVVSGWWTVVLQAFLFVVFAAILRQDLSAVDLSLFLTMGIGFGYLRMLTGSVWMSIGFHTAFQTGAQLVLSHDAVTFAGDTGAAMLAVGALPFTVAAILLSGTGLLGVVTNRDDAAPRPEPEPPLT